MHVDRNIKKRKEVNNIWLTKKFNRQIVFAKIKRKFKKKNGKK